MEPRDRRRGHWLHPERIRSARSGQALVWVAVMLPFFLSIVGLAIDGGMVFDARRKLQNVADGAARAGAIQIDPAAYRASGGTRVVLDETKARDVAASYVVAEGDGISATITTSPQQVVVTASQPVALSFLRLVGLRTVTITAMATAEVRYGITRGNQEREGTDESERDAGTTRRG